MTGIIDWAAARARMVLAFIVLSLTVGAAAYVGLPKEGEPDIDIPGLFVSVPFPGISATDSERQLVRPMEAEFKDLDGLKSINSTAAEGYAGIFIEFEFGWDKSATIADVRDAMNRAETQFPKGAENYSINEINFSEFPIIIVALSGNAPERTLIRLAQDLQTRLEGLSPILEAGIAGARDEMLEVLIDPLSLEAYNVTAQELISAVANNNQLIAAGVVDTPTGALSVRIPSSFESPQDVYDLPVKVNGDRVVTLGDLAQIRLTYEDRTGAARFNGNPTIALQVVKRQGFNIIDTAELVRQEVAAFEAEWPEELRAAVHITTSLDQSNTVASMVAQLEGSVLTAIALVMIVVLATLGTRSALLVGFAIPTSFLLCFIFLGIMGIAVSNIVMFGLILAVGMLVDGAIVVVEYADKRLAEGARPMQAYTDSAKRMFWPVISSTATTLCAFLPMLFWPGVPGEFMGMLPVTLIFVLSASLIVALVYLPVMGGVAARLSRSADRFGGLLMRLVPSRAIRIALGVVVGFALFQSALMVMRGGGAGPDTPALLAILPGVLAFSVTGLVMSVVMGTLIRPRAVERVEGGYKRTRLGLLIERLVGNPFAPVLTIAAVLGFVVVTFSYYGANNNGVDFFVETEPENAIVYVRARGNLSVEEKDALVAQVEARVLGFEGVRDVFAFSGDGGLNNNTGGASAPEDTIGQVQIDLAPWGTRADGNIILDAIQAELDTIPGIHTEIFEQANGPANGKPIDLELTGDDWAQLQQATADVHAYFENLEGLTLIEDTLPLPGIDWQINVDVEAAGRYGANVATVGAMVQLVTRGILLDRMRVPTSDDEIEIRVRFPEDARVLSTLDTLRVRTADGLVPLSNFVTWEPVRRLAEIKRLDQSRIFQVKADVISGLMRVTIGDRDLGLLRNAAPEHANRPAEFSIDGRDYVLHSLAEGVSRAEFDDALNGDVTLTAITANERIAHITAALETGTILPDGVNWQWGGDQAEQAESQAFLSQAFAASLGLMFIILLAQFNSFYNSVLVLLAVVLSTAGVLIGLLTMGQSFSIIMTGTGIVALAGIVVNNNIVLIDTYQEYNRYLAPIEAIIRTVEARIRPVLLTTITTMAGLAPMMLGISLDFANGGYTIDSPTALWWKNLATAVVFGLGIATVLTLVFTPSLLAVRVWWNEILGWIAQALARIGAARLSQRTQDYALARAALETANPLILWEDDTAEDQKTQPAGPTVHAAQ